MDLLIRALLVLALAVVTVSAAPHAPAGPAVDVHAAHATHADHHGHGTGQDEHGTQDHPACCPSLSVHCGIGGVLSELAWSPADRLSVVIVQTGRGGVGPVAAMPEFEPPPPRA